MDLLELQILCHWVVYVIFAHQIQCVKHFYFSNLLNQNGSHVSFVSVKTPRLFHLNNVFVSPWKILVLVLYFRMV